VGGGGALVGWFNLFLIAGGALFGLGVVLFALVSRRKDPSALPDPDELGAFGRKLLRPLRQDREEIAKLIERHRDKPHIQAVGAEVLKDVDGLIAQAARLALKAKDLQKLSRGQTKAEAALDDLQSRMDKATTEVERAAYRDALEAKKGELNSYSSVQEAKGKVEASILQAHARISEIKSLLIASAVRTSVDDSESHDLREKVGRLQALRSSLDEAETLFDSPSS
jgi:DNA repair exonuclease SbcCD ATPase subunit